MDKNRFLIKRSFLIAISSLMLLAILSQSGWTECMVRNLSLEKKGDYTHFSIYTSADFEFIHFIEPPKEDKPHRIVIDLFDAIHKLPQKNFYDLPAGIIKDIRTSQYQITPRKITRVVLDLEKPVVYKVEQKDEEKLTFALLASEDKPFKIWTSKPSELELTKKAETETQVSSQPKEEQGLALKASEKKSVAQKKAEVFLPESEKKEKIASKTSETKVASEKQAVSVEKAKKVSGEKPTAKQKKLTQAENLNLAVLPSPKKEKSISGPKSGEKKIGKKPVASELETAIKVIPDTAFQDTFLVVDTLLKEKIKLDTIPGRKVLIYSSFGRRDPFVPLTEKISFEFGEAPLPDVESLKLVGVLEDGFGLRALLEDDQGYGYIMEQGDEVKNGFVLKVFRDKIVFEITEYGWSRTVSLELSTEVKMER